MAKIVIDPGHGGDDRTNLGPNGYVEADGMLKLAQLVKVAIYNKYGVYVELTRETDKTMSLTERGMMGAGADLFMSLHTNAGTYSVRGTEVFYSVDLPDDRQWAEQLSKNIATAFGVPNRRGKVNESQRFPDEDYFTVMDVSQDMGAKHVFLVESLFHSNKQDEAILLSTEGINIIVDNIVKLIADVLKLEEVEVQQTSPWAVDGRAWVMANKVSDGTRPKDTPTREEIWTMLHQASKLG